MARGKEKFGQLMLDNEDSLCKIRGNVRLLEMLHDEWSRLRVHDLGPSTTGDEFLERRFGVASKLREDLARIEEDLLSVNQRMVNDLSQYNTNRMKPIFQRIERRFNNRMVFEFDSFNHSSKTVDRATTVARVASGSDHSERLYKHYNWLLDKVDACSVANKMFEYRAISKPQLESVQVYRNNLCRAVEILLKIILAEPVPVYDAFKEALIETNQDDVYLTLAGIDLDTDRRFKHTVLIRQQYVYFVKKIEPEVSGLLGELYANGVLEQHEKEEIGSEATTTRKNETLLSILCRKTYEKFEIFLQSLEKTGQGHLVAVIRGDYRHVASSEERTTETSIETVGR